MSRLEFEIELVNGGPDAELTYGLQHSEHMPSYSTAPYLNPRQNRCTGKDNTCMAYSTKDSRETAEPLCVGCGRSEHQ
jgi:hypothetical protein